MTLEENRDEFEAQANKIAQIKIGQKSQQARNHFYLIFGCDRNCEPGYYRRYNLLILTEQ